MLTSKAECVKKKNKKKKAEKLLVTQYYQNITAKNIKTRQGDAFLVSSFPRSTLMTLKTTSLNSVAFLLKSYWNGSVLTSRLLCIKQNKNVFSDAVLLARTGCVL